VAAAQGNGLPFIKDIPPKIVFCKGAGNVNVLSRLKIRTKLVVLAALSVISVLAMLAGASALMRGRMTEDRIDKARAVVQSVQSLMDSLARREADGELTHDQALGELRAMFAAIRFDNGDGYLYAFSGDGVFVAHGAMPSLVGATAKTLDEQGRPVLATANLWLASGPEAILRFWFSKPGSSETHEKLGYFVRFAPWGLTMGTGIYIDDLNEAFVHSIKVLERFQADRKRSARSSSLSERATLSARLFQSG